jgi:hypothetical protein
MWDGLRFRFAIVWLEGCGGKPAAQAPVVPALRKMREERGTQLCGTTDRRWATRPLMKYFRSALSSWLLLCSITSSLVSQGSKPHKPTAPEQVGSSIVEALKNRDIATLIALIPLSGITVGTDGPTISLASFKRQLQQRRGVYCVLMDSSCIRDAGKSEKDDSLRGLILRQPVRLDTHSVGGAPKVVEVVVRKETGPRDVLFNLFLKNDRGNWKLEGIEYD